MELSTKKLVNKMEKSISLIKKEAKVFTSQGNSYKK